MEKNTFGRRNTKQTHYLPRPALTVRYCSAYLFLFLQFFLFGPLVGAAIVGHGLVAVGGFLRCEIGVEKEKHKSHETL